MSDAEQRYNEISGAVSVLRRYGMKIDLSEEMKGRLSGLVLFDGDDALFKNLLLSTSIYFEYGCGNSTEYVYKFSDADIYSADTNKAWASTLGYLKDNDQGRKCAVSWIDVGQVGDWGHPLSFEKRDNFLQYANCLWQTGIQPDLVLIDGRFRILCLLVCIKFGAVGTKILFDDYFDRHRYHVAEEFLPVADQCGRQALFIVDEQAKVKIVEDVILEFKNVIE